MKVRMKVSKVLGTLQSNRDKHHNAFLDACDGYKERFIAAMTKAIEQLKHGDILKTSIYMTPPEDHTKDYDRVIKMLEMSVDDTVEMDEESVQQLIQDDWRWKDQWREVTNSYAKTKV